MAVKHKIEFTETATILAIATGLFILIDLIIGFQAYKDYSLKRNLLVAERKIAANDIDGAVKALVKARKARPNEPSPHLVLAKVLSDRGAGGTSLTADQVYSDLIGLAPRNPDGYVGYTIHALKEYYRTDPDIESPDNLLSLIDDLSSSKIATAISSSSQSYDAKMMRLYLDAEAVLLQARSGKWRGNSFRLSKKAKTQGLYRDAKSLAQDLGDLTVELEGIIPRENLPSVETMVAIHNVYGCMMVLQADINAKDKNRLKKYEAAIGAFRRAMSYHTGSPDPVANVFNAFARLMANPSITPSRFEYYHNQFRSAEKEARFFFKRDYDALFGHSVRKAILASAKGLFNKAMKAKRSGREPKETMDDLTAALNLLKGAVRGMSKEEVIYVSLQRIRVIFEMLDLEKKSGVPPPYPPGKNRPWAVQDLREEIRGTAALMKGNGSKLEYIYTIQKAQVFAWTGSIDEMEEALAELAVWEVDPVLTCRMLKQRSICFDIVGWRKQGEAVPEVVEAYRKKAITAYMKFIEIVGKLELDERFEEDVARAQARAAALAE